MRYQKIVVTGGAGRLGRYVTENLRQRCDLTVLDRVPVNVPGIRSIEAEITDYEGLKRSFAGQDAVVHLAAIPNPRTAPPDVTFRINVQGTWAVLQAAEDCGVKRVVVASSDATLGLHYNPPGWGPQYLPIDEGHPLDATLAQFSPGDAVSVEILRDGQHVTLQVTLGTRPAGL